jgi:multimeric flavodoxin WrbA
MDTIYDIGYTGKVSNSEALLLASMWGAHKEGAEVELIYPGDNIPDFDGVVLSTPVYFGDRSSTLHRFIREVYLKEKAVGVVSAGAKRNGGQETTNIYALYDCLVQGALITGNGPPTAQYGGTGWAGNKTSIVNDDFGIKTSYGTGIQVARLAKVVTAKESERRPKVTFVVVTKDHMDMSFTDMWFKNFDVEIVDITKFNIRKCIACPVCPNGDLTKDYKCIIKNDDMDEVRKPMVRGDCIIFVSGTDDTEFQEFIERTRFIRRDHFELSERVYSSISVTSSITDILPLRIMTNLLRQNMFGLPFLKEFKKTFSIPFRGYAPMIEKFTRKSITMREKTGIDNEYTAVGYEDAKIDEKAYRD